MLQQTTNITLSTFYILVDKAKVNKNFRSVLYAHARAHTVQVKIESVILTAHIDRRFNVDETVNLLKYKSAASDLVDWVKLNLDFGELNFFLSPLMIAIA